jgi:hypothetical protein
VVSSLGVLVRNSGVTGVVVAIGNQYTITFNQPVNSCTWIAQLGATGTASAPSEGQGMVYTAAVTGNTAQVRVWTFDKGGSSTARPFHLAVFC